MFIDNKIFYNLFLLFLSLPIFFFFGSLFSYFYLTLIILPKLVSLSNFFDNKISLKDHGINNTNHYRLGGLIIMIFFFLKILFGADYIFLDRDNINLFLVILFVISFIGFVDDVYGGLNYKIKFIFLLLTILILLLFYNEFIFQKTFFNFLNNLLQIKILSLFISLIIIMGFVNASNISDGANGILSGTSAVVFLILYQETKVVIYYDLFIFLIIFFILNIFLSNLYLGDTGSYFLGFLISSICLYYYNYEILGAGFLASLLSYPCIEIVYSITRRLMKNQNPLKPDNQHLHNLIFNYFNKLKISNFNNSLTGLTIISLFSFPVLFFYFLEFGSYNYIYWLLFIMQIILYFFIHLHLQKKLN